MKKDFTLVELLVVVSVIAILIALLLPALGKARDKARGISCLGNMKTSGQLIHMYANDSGGNVIVKVHNSYSWLRYLQLTDWVRNVSKETNAPWCCPLTKGTFSQKNNTKLYYHYGWVGDLLEDVKTAREFGDLSENFEYKAAKREKSRNDSRMAFLWKSPAQMPMLVDSRTIETTNPVLEDGGPRNAGFLKVTWPEGPRAWTAHDPQTVNLLYVGGNAAAVSTARMKTELYPKLEFARQQQTEW